MKKRVIWLGAFLISLLLCVSALAFTNPPQSAGDVPVPDHTVPAVTNIIISGNNITMDVSGTCDFAVATITAIMPSGSVQRYVYFTVDSHGLSATVTGLPSDTTSWELWQVSIYNAGTPGVSMDFSYDAAGALQYYSIQEGLVNADYNFDDQGQLTSYYTDDMHVYYEQDGSLNSYTVITATGQQTYNGQNELEFESIRDTAAGTTTEKYYEDGVLMQRYVTNANGWYGYDGQGTLRRSTVIGADGLITYKMYDVYGDLFSYSLQTSSGTEEYDAGGNLVGKSFFGAAGQTYEKYRDGKLVRKTVSGNLPDGRPYEDIYDNGVYTERIIYEAEEAYHYDVQGSYTGKTVYDVNGGYQEYNAEGVLTKYTVYSEQQGGVLLTYNHRNALQSLECFDAYSYDLYRYDAKKKVWYLNDLPYDGPVPIILAELKLKQEIIWYPNNTVCSFGPQFRDIKPDLTDLWYMFTPVDVSRDGTQTFELIGSNMYVLGQVAVTVSGDSVTVNYSTVKGKYGHIYVKSEYLNFFPDLASVKTVVPEELGKGFRFGQAISIQKDLGGDTNVLMFVRNVATYRNFVDKDTLLRRYYKNYPSRVKLRDAMLAMMD